MFMNGYKRHSCIVFNHTCLDHILYSTTNTTNNSRELARRVGISPVCRDPRFLSGNNLSDAKIKSNRKKLVKAMVDDIKKITTTIIVKGASLWIT